FDNAAGQSTITALSVVGTNGAVKVGTEVGSPGRIVTPQEQQQVSAPGTVSATVVDQLALNLGAPAVFEPIVAGIAKDYFASTVAQVTSTAGGSTLTVTDGDTVAPGHLVNGTLAIPQALQANADDGAYAAISNAPATLRSYGSPVTNQTVTIGFK